MQRARRGTPRVGICLAMLLQLRRQCVRWFLKVEASLHCQEDLAVLQSAIRAQPYSPCARCHLLPLSVNRSQQK
jgi:hypothetical protein